jgi:hypothetical protein
MYTIVAHAIHNIATCAGSNDNSQMFGASQASPTLAQIARCLSISAAYQLAIACNLACTSARSGNNPAPASCDMSTQQLAIAMYAAAEKA